MRYKLEELWREVCYGGRLLAKNRGFTAIVGLTLALGIGSTSAIFSVLYATVLAPLPFPDAERLVWIEEIDREGRQRPIPTGTLDIWRRQSRTLERVANGLMGQVNFTVTGPAGAERVVLEQVDFETLEVLGTHPLLGRWFQPDEVLVQGNTARTIVISYGLWQRVFGGSPDAVGKRLPGWSAGWGEIVIGVMPRGFYTAPDRSSTDAWYVIANNPGPTIGRLKSGIRIEEAQAELATLRDQETAAGTGRPVRNATRLEVSLLHDVYRNNYAPRVYMLMGAVVFVLLIAIVNVANLQLNRGVRRHSEMATRTALGAGRWRLFRQLIMENVTLALFGGGLGILVASVGIDLFVLLAPTFYPPSEEIQVNGPVLAFTLSVCLAAGIMSGLVPALRASTLDVSSSLKQSARSIAGRVRLGVRRVLVVSEIALAMVLLVGAGLMINSYARLTSVNVGLNPDKVLSMEVNLAGMDRYRTRHGTNHYSVTPEVSNFYTKVLERVALMPGVVSVAATSNLPPRNGPILPFQIIGRPREETDSAEAGYHEVSSSYFETMRIPLLRGRPFDDRDGENAPGVVIISEALARQYFRDENPIGQSILVNMNAQNPELEADRVREIVGVAGDIRMDLTSGFMSILYIPYRQSLKDYSGFATFFIHAMKGFVIRTSGDPAALVPNIRGAFAAADPAVAVTDLMPMQQRLASLAAGSEFWMQLLGVFAGLGVFLAAIGVYGVMSYAVEQRSHEFGIRTTFGARRSDILRQVLREGTAVTLAGIAIGVAGASGATQFIKSQLFEVTPMDPITIAAVALLLLAIALLACYIPARRATKLDPLSVLRTE
jgi:putative ABC transport system permease protein